METHRHRYIVAATGGPEGPVPVEAEGPPTIETAAAARDDEPGERWSPENLLMAAVADGFVLGLRALAQRRGLEWRHLICQVEATPDLEQAHGGFTEIRLQAELIVPFEGVRAEATRCLEETQRRCPIANSLKATLRLHPRVTVSED